MSVTTDSAPSVDCPPRGRELDELLGLRSSKGRYYREYRHSRHDLERTLAAVNAMSWLLAGAGGDPRKIVTETLPVIARLLDASSVVLVTDHPGFGGGVEIALPHPASDVVDPTVVPLVRGQLRQFGVDDLPGGRMCPVPSQGVTLLVAPLPRAGRPCGCVVAVVANEAPVDGTDLAILGSLTNMLAGAVESAWRLQEAETMRDAATSAAHDAALQAAALVRRNQLLHETRHELLAAQEWQVLAEERQRIARDLHDSVAQHVLSMGMQVEWCRVASNDADVAARLSEVKELARTTVDRIRQAIFELAGSDELAQGLVAALRRTADRHRVDGLAILVRVTGKPVRLPARVEQALFLVAKEALFNIVLHAEATRASLSIAYRQGEVRLRLADDGVGCATALQASLEQSRRGHRSGHHRGLGNIDERVRLVGGSLRISDALPRGVRLQILVPADGGRR